MRFANKGLPAVALVTEKFWTQGGYVAKVAGLPDLPRVQLPHPIAGTSRDEMRIVAEQVAGVILDRLRG